MLPGDDGDDVAPGALGLRLSASLSDDARADHLGRCGVLAMPKAGRKSPPGLKSPTGGKRRTKGKRKPGKRLGAEPEPEPEPELGGRALAESVFRRIDLDGNGTVDRLEVQKFVLAEGLGYHGAIMRQIDADGSGSVSLDEFCDWWLEPEPEPEPVQLAFPVPPAAEPGAVSDVSAAVAARARASAEIIKPPQAIRVVGIGGARHATTPEPLDLVRPGSAEGLGPNPLTATDEWHRFAQSHHDAESLKPPVLGDPREGKEALDRSCAELKESDDARLAVLAAREREVAAAGFDRKGDYMLKVEAVNMPMTTIRPYKLNRVTEEGVLHLEQYLNPWDDPPLAVAPETLELDLGEMVFRHKQAQKQLDKEAAADFAKRQKQRRKVEKLAADEGTVEEQVAGTTMWGAAIEAECAAIEAAATEEYGKIRTQQQSTRALHHAECALPSSDPHASLVFGLASGCLGQGGGGGASAARGARKVRGGPASRPGQDCGGGAQPPAVAAGGGEPLAAEPDRVGDRADDVHLQELHDRRVDHFRIEGGWTAVLRGDGWRGRAGAAGSRNGAAA